MNDTLSHIIEHIDSVTKGVEKTKLDAGFLCENSHSIESISKKLGLNPRQSVLYAVAFKMSLYQDEFTLDDLTKYTKLDLVDIPFLFADFQELEKTGFVTRKNSKESFSLLKSPYIINQKIILQLLSNKSLQTNKLSNLTLNEIIDNTANLIFFNNNNYHPLSDMLCDFKVLFAQNKNNEFIKAVEKSLDDDYDRLLFVFLCHQTLTQNDIINTGRLLDLMFGERTLKYSILRKLITKTSQLITQNLAEVFDDEDTGRVIMLTDKARKLLGYHDTGCSKKIKRHILLFPWFEISHKKLYHNPEEGVEIEKLRRILTSGRYSKFTKQLALRGMPEGITVLFHGASGTGKTETAYQLARYLKRDLFIVDVSMTKNKYFGESEKMVKKIFDDYKELLSTQDKPPIMLFNEADAIFSKRKSEFIGNVTQTENAIQNIILQELERFKGVLIATTNLPINFDRAFDRRFLFKIKFSPPHNAVSQRIWKLKIPSLKPKEIKLLVENYKLTGAQIDNVVRKLLVEELSSMKKIQFDSLIQYCANEQNYGKKKTVMGFRV